MLWIYRKTLFSIAVISLIPLGMPFAAESTSDESLNPRVIRPAKIERGTPPTRERGEITLPRQRGEITLPRQRGEIIPPKDVLTKDSVHVEYKDSTFPLVIAGKVSFKAFAQGAGLRKLSIHLRGPIGLPTDKDREIKTIEKTRGENKLEFDGTIDISAIPPGRYVYYVDAYNSAGQRGRTQDRLVRIAPSEFKPRVMFDSDYTHILNVESPYNINAAKTRFLDASMNKAKNEAAFKEILNSHADTLVLSPGVGEIGYYRSRYYPITQHRDWWKSKTGTLPAQEPLVNYALNGGDPIDDARGVADKLRKKLFVSIRMNDGHAFYNDTWINPNTGDILQAKSASNYRIYSQFMATHLKYQIGDDESLPTPRYRYLLDYTKGSSGEDPVTHLKNNVRDHKIAIVKGMLDEHRVDGVVLDFLRLAYMFNRQTTDLATRRQVMKSLIADIRSDLDKRYKGKPGDVPQLFIRIPVLPEEWDKMGIVVPDLALAGVDGFILSFERVWAQPFYYATGKDPDTLVRLDKWKPVVGNAVSFIFEMNQTVERRYAPLPSAKKENYSFWRRTRDQMFISGAFAAKSLGADGFYLFNLPYYRGINAYDDPETRVTPPFALFDCLKSFACMGSTSQPYYFLAAKDSLDYESLPDGMIQLPKKVDPEGSSIVLYAPKPMSGWPAKMRLRIELKEPNIKLANVLVNGVQVSEISDVSEPYSTPFRYANCDPTRTQAFDVPPTALNNARVVITVTPVSGTHPSIRWVDLTAME